MMKIYWNGSIPCRNVQWILENEQIVLDAFFEEQREKIWREIQSEHPDSYDGDILVLKDFNVANNQMVLNMNLIKFSRILTLEKLGEYLRPYGTIGMQMIVLSPDRRHILFGQRVSTSMYCPGYYSCPGGMLELVDAKGTFEEACLREFHEEVEIDISNELTLHAITSEINGTVGAVFLLSGTAKMNPDVGLRIKGNEEWEENHLTWHSIRDLDRFDYSNSLESIIFAKEYL